MECYTIKNLTFSYPLSKGYALNGININIKKGEFITIFGKSGCGKTTLLRLLKPAIAPHGEIGGEVLLEDKDIKELDKREACEKIGFVMQNPDNQIVTDKVYHELAFGLESLGFSNEEIRTRVAEMASFFGIGNWFYKNTSELSGGQKQILNLAGTMAMQPSVLILDEPTSQLDPIAASEFLNMVKRINNELGVTVVLSEHRLEEAFLMSDRVIGMADGKIICDTTPEMAATQLKDCSLEQMLPIPMRVFSVIDSDSQTPVSIREARERISEMKGNIKNEIVAKKYECDEEVAVELKDVWFKYGKDLDDTVKGLNIKAYKGELFCVLGGNGTGKTTMLSLISGVLKPYRGKVYLYDVDAEELDESEKFNEFLGVLGQNPQTLFAKKTVKLELMEMLDVRKCSKDEKEAIALKTAKLCGIEKLMDRHPYDLSGGEMQKVALAKVLLTRPKILLLDEPTKGLDSYYKQEFADVLLNLKEDGVCIIMVSHDVEFCAKYADRCAMFFDGNITSVSDTRSFFAGNSFYTTASNRMARHIIKEAILPEDIIYAFGFENEKRERKKTDIYDSDDADTAEGDYNKPPEDKKRNKLSKRTLFATLSVLILVPLTILFGIHYLGDRKYYFISLLIMLEVIFPFVMVFEKRKPQARELVIISVMCALAVGGRVAFAALPQFKPVLAIVIISGVCFGAETGFLVGAVTGFVSNMFLSQGPWTPWQMFAFGIVGFIAGILFSKGLLGKNRISLCVYGGFSAIVLYGGIINPASVIMWQNNPTWEMFVAAYISGLPFDIIHGVATVVFLWLISAPMIEKLERIKIKYGLIERN